LFNAIYFGLNKTAEIKYCCAEMICWKQKQIVVFEDFVGEVSNLNNPLRETSLSIQIKNPQHKSPTLYRPPPMYGASTPEGSQTTVELLM